MNRLWALTAYLAWVFVGAAAVSPGVWWVATRLAEAFPEACGWLGGHPFSRYVHRCLLVLALLGIGPLTAALGCRGLAALGWTRDRRAVGRMARGWGVGFVGFAALFLIELSGGARTWKADLTAAAAIAGAAKALVAAVVVSGIEETLFRGVAFAGLRPAVGGPNALVLSALLYSAAHFFARPEPPARPGIGSGFETLAGMMTGFADPDRLIPAFATLFVLGSVLALSRWDAGDLYFAFGLHSGVVFWSKMRGVLTRTAPGNAGGGDLVSGWPALALACVVLVLYWVIRRERFRAGDGVRQPFTEVDPGCHL